MLDYLAYLTADGSSFEERRELIADKLYRYMFDRYLSLEHLFILAALDENSAFDLTDKEKDEIVEETAEAILSYIFEPYNDIMNVYGMTNGNFYKALSNSGRVEGGISLDYE